MKKVSMKAKPTSNIRAEDEWVAQSENTAKAEQELQEKNEQGRAGRAGGSTPSVARADQAPANLKRLTIDIPEELHARIKMQCASRRRKMADEIRVLLENNFSA